MDSLIQTPEHRAQEIDKELIKVNIIDAPGFIMFGLGIYGKFGTNGDAFHPLLNDPDVFHSLLGVGAAIIAWGGYKTITLVREKAKLKDEFRV